MYTFRRKVSFADQTADNSDQYTPKVTFFNMRSQCRVVFMLQLCACHLGCFQTQLNNSKLF